MHGIGQGNGTGPAIWAVLSTPILNLLHKLGFGCFLITPITNIPPKNVGYSFADDTDLIQSNPILWLPHMVKSSTLCSTP
jgi:hypothetical protein